MEAKGMEKMVAKYSGRVRVAEEAGLVPITGTENNLQPTNGGDENSPGVTDAKDWMLAMETDSTSFPLEVPPQTPTETSTVSEEVAQPPQQTQVSNSVEISPDPDIIEEMKAGKRVSTCAYHLNPGCDGDKDPQRLVCPSCFQKGRLSQVKKLLGLQDYGRKSGYPDRPKTQKQQGGFLHNLINAAIGAIDEKPETTDQDLIPLLEGFCERDKSVAKKAVDEARYLIKLRKADEEKKKKNMHKRWEEIKIQVKLWLDQYGQVAFEGGSEISEWIEDIKTKFSLVTCNGTIEKALEEHYGTYFRIFNEFLFDRCKTVVEANLEYSHKDPVDIASQMIRNQGNNLPERAHKMLVKLIYERMPVLKAAWDEKKAQEERERRAAIEARRAKMIELANKGASFREGGGNKRYKHGR